MNNNENTQQIVICGNNIEVLKQYPDNYFDSVVTDAPYGLGKEPNCEEMLSAWITDGYLEVKGSGFMGKEWDAFVPQPIFWKEVYRVLKHGGHIISFFGTRTYDWGCMAIRLAGFEVRDCIQWLYGSGFPKSHNISKAIDKLNGNEIDNDGYIPNQKNNTHGKNWGGGNKTKVSVPIDDLAKQWDGWGSALKPANEPIVLARKPLEKGLSIAENVLKWGTGGINIDASRIGTNDVLGREQNKDYQHFKCSNYQDVYWDNSKGLGRFPANIILTHHPECSCEYYKEEPTSEEVQEEWSCVDACPIKIMDEQSGESNSVMSERGNIVNNAVYGKYNQQDNTTRGHNDSGGASRFFYTAKASQWEKNFGLDDFEQKQSVGGGGGVGDYLDDVNSSSGNFGSEKAPSKNIHPTIKPIQLMQYLVRLVTRPNGIVLDAFCGSGTTGVACKIDGFNFVGIDISEEYTEIAKARINAFNEENKLLEDTIVYKYKNKETDISPNQLSMFD